MSTRYLRSFLLRMESLNHDAHLAPRTFVEPDKDVGSGAGFVDVEFDVDLEERLGAESAHHAVSPRRQRYFHQSLVDLVRSRDMVRVAVLLGDPGSGKSVALRRLGLGLARAALEDERSPVPVYVPLGAFSKDPPTTKGVKALIRRSIEEISPADTELTATLQARLQSGGVVLLFDGMDEMPLHEFSARLKALHEFATLDTKARCLFACRIGDFQEAQFPAQVIRLMPFRRQQIARFLELYLRLDARSAAAWARRLLDPAAQVASLASNPLYLTLVASYVARNDSVPQTQPEIFRSFIEPRLQEAIASAPGAEIEAVRDALGRLALSMTEDATVGTTIPLQEALSRARLDPETGPGVLEVARAAGFVRFGDPDGAFRFLHHRLQEFFAALALASLPAEEVHARLLPHIDDPWWTQIFTLVASQGVGMDPLVRRVLDDSAADAEDTESDRLLQESRLILIGEILQATEQLPSALLLDRLGDAISARYEAAAGLLAELRRVRAVRAIRGPLVSLPRPRAILQECLEGGSLWLQEEAYIALTTGRSGRNDLRPLWSLYKDAFTHNFILRYPSILRAAESEPRLSFLVPHARRAAAINLALLLGVLAAVGVCGWLLGGRAWGFGLLGGAGLLAGINLNHARRRSDPAGVVAMWVRILVAGLVAAATSLALSALTQVIHQLGDGPAAWTRDEWGSIETPTFTVALIAAGLVTAHGLITLVTGGAWRRFARLSWAAAAGFRRGAWTWALSMFVVAIIAHEEGGNVSAIAEPWLVQLSIFLLLAILILAFLLGLRPTTGEFARILGWIRTEFSPQTWRRRLPGVRRTMSWRWFFRGLGEFLGEVAGPLVLVGLFAAASWGLAQFLDAGKKGGFDSLSFWNWGGFVIAALALVALAILALVLLWVWVIEPIKRRIRYSPKREDPNKMPGILSLLSAINDYDLSSARKKTAIRKLAETDTPTEVLVETLSSMPASNVPDHLRAALSRTVNILQERFRQRGHEEPLIRMRREVDMARQMDEGLFRYSSDKKQLRHALAGLRRRWERVEGTAKAFDEVTDDEMRKLFAEPDSERAEEGTS